MADLQEEKNSQAVGKSELDLALERDAKAWEENIDSFLEGKLQGRTPVIVFKQTPLILQLLGAKNTPTVTSAGTLKKILQDKHKLSPEVVKQVPMAMSDPVMIFKSATQGGDLVMMLDLKDQDGATLVVPVALEERGEKGHEVNRVKSIYCKNNIENSRPNNQWFVKQINDGNLIYQNKQKSREWFVSAGLQLPRVARFHSQPENKIYHYDDFVKFQNQNEKLERWQLAAWVQFPEGKLRNALEKTLLNPDTLVKLHDDLKAMEGEYQSFLKVQQERIPGLEKSHTKNTDEIEALTAGIELRDKGMGLEPCMYINGHIYGVKNELAFAKEVLGPAARKSAKNDRPQEIGQYRGFNVLVHSPGRGRGVRFFIQGAGKPHTTPELRYEGKDNFRFADFSKRLDNCLGRFEAIRKEAQEQGMTLARELENAKTGQGFPKMEMLNALRGDDRQALIELRLVHKDPTYKSTWKPKSWDLAKAQEQALAKAAVPAKESEKVTPKEKGKGFGR